MGLNIYISMTSFAQFDEAPLELLRARDFDLSFNAHGRRITSQELLDEAAEIDGLIAGTEALTAEVLMKLPRLKVISRCGTGLDSVDVAKAKELGIKVCNTPDATTLPVAELAVGLILSLLRNVCAMNSQMKSGVWKKQMGELLFGKTVGIIGFGRIGQAIAQRLLPFGVQVLYYDPLGAKDVPYARYVELEQLYEQSDIISLHVPLTDITKGLVNREAFLSMKKGSYLINCSRGGVVDENELVQVLQQGHLAGAAVDVFGEEPYNGPLLSMDNVIVTPHIGSYAKQARIQMETEAVNNLIEALDLSLSQG